MVGRRQSHGERIFTQILTKCLKYKMGKSYPISKYKGHVLSRANLDTGDFYKNCVWNITGFGTLEIDFCFPEDKLAIEIDGGYHNYPERIEKDRKRDIAMKKAGWYIIRIPDYCVANTLSWMLVDKNKIIT